MLTLFLLEKKRLHKNSFNSNRHLTISRVNIKEDIFSYYKQDSSLSVSDVTVSFKGEIAVDIGGVKKEAFSLFWEEVCKPCYNLFYGENAKVPVVSCFTDGNTFEV